MDNEVQCNAGFVLDHPPAAVVDFLDCRRAGTCQDDDFSQNVAVRLFSLEHFTVSYHEISSNIF